LFSLSLLPSFLLSKTSLSLFLSNNPFSFIFLPVCPSQESENESIVAAHESKMFAKKEEEMEEVVEGLRETLEMMKEEYGQLAEEMERREKEEAKGDADGREEGGGGGGGGEERKLRQRLAEVERTNKTLHQGFYKREIALQGALAGKDGELEDMAFQKAECVEQLNGLANDMLDLSLNFSRGALVGGRGGGGGGGEENMKEETLMGTAVEEGDDGDDDTSSEREDANNKSY